MYNIEELIREILKEFKNENKIFVSEKDFQLELAWRIKEKTNNSKEKVNVLLEYCHKDLFIDYDGIDKDGNLKDKRSQIHIDILIIYDNKWYPIELKYKTKHLIYDGYFNEKYELKEHSARDQGKCKYLWDIMRLEKIKDHIKKSKNNTCEFGEGFAILLTNDDGYYDSHKKDNNKKSKEPPTDYNFRLSPNRKINKTETLNWENNPSYGTIGSCPLKIEFKEDIEEFKWEDGAYIADEKNGKFMWLMVKVK